MVEEAIIWALKKAHQHSELNSSCIHVLLVIAVFVDKQMCCKLSHRVLRELTHYCEQTIYTAIVSLEEARLLKRLNDPGRVSVYQLLLEGEKCQTARQLD